MSDEIFIPDQNSSADLIARWVLMLAHLYYDRGVSLVDDATYDELSCLVADRWDELSETRQTMLGSPDEIRATGSGVLLSRAAIGAAERLADDLGVALEPFQPTFDYELEDDSGSFDLAAIQG